MREAPRAAAWPVGVVWLLLGSLCLSFAFEAFLESEFSALMVLNSASQRATVQSLGGEVRSFDADAVELDAPFIAIWIASLSWSALAIACSKSAK